LPKRLDVFEQRRAIFMALVSLLNDRTIRSDTAMTGEISLRGLVLPVGGIKEKVVAAHSAGIRRVMLPARNRKETSTISRKRSATRWSSSGWSGWKRPSRRRSIRRRRRRAWGLMLGRRCEGWSQERRAGPAFLSWLQGLSNLLCASCADRFAGA
jgi:hypothetical protein